MFTHEFRNLSGRLAEKCQIYLFSIRSVEQPRGQSDLVQLVEEGAQAIVVIGGKHSANTQIGEIGVLPQSSTFRMKQLKTLFLKPFENSIPLELQLEHHSRVHYSQCVKSWDQLENLSMSGAMY